MSNGFVFPNPMYERTLSNGLKVVAVPYDSPGLVAYWTVVRTGSRNEIEPGKSGFAHFFEHMMFRGTERFPRERYEAILKEIGSDHNAFTSDDMTCYHILASSSSLETLMEIESDRFMRLQYPVEDFKKEAGAVLGEYNKNASSPFLIMTEKLREAAFTTHTYRHTTMGFLRDIEDMPSQYEYSRQFFSRFYRPENCILMAVGDVDSGNLFALAQKHYGGWRRGTYKFEVPTEPPQKEEKRVEIPWPNPTLPYLYAGYHGPAFSADDIDMPALDIISQLIFGDAAPLYQKLLVEEQEVDFLHGGAADHRDPYLFEIIVRIKNPDRVTYVEDAITTAFEGLKTNRVEPQRLDRVKSHLRYGFAMSLNTAANASRSLAHYAALTGDPGTVNRVYAMYERVTPEDVQTIARKYFDRTARTVVILRHEEAGGDETA